MDDTHDRLARLEDAVSDVRVDLSAVSTQVRLGFEAINAKIDATNAKIDASKDIPARVTALETSNQQAQLQKAEAVKRRGATWKALAGVVSIVVALAGLILKITLGG